jgi:hypothetical protein
MNALLENIRDKNKRDLTRTGSISSQQSILFYTDKDKTLVNIDQELQKYSANMVGKKIITEIMQGENVYTQLMRTNIILGYIRSKIKSTS